MDYDYQIVWRGRFLDFTGFAGVNRGMALALDSLGVDVKIELDNGDSSIANIPAELQEKLISLVNKPLAKDKKKILIYNYPHGMNIEEERKKYDYIFLNVYWEADRVPKYWFPNVNNVDAILAPSNHNKWAYENSGITVPTFVVRHGIDADDFSHKNEKFGFKDYDDCFKFLSVFHWQHRKAPEVLIEAFTREFRSADKVVLFIKTHIGYLNKEHQNYRLQQAINFRNGLGIEDKADIIITNSIMEDSHLKGLYSNSDCFVLPSRGEGIGMPYLEAMASGLPVIATSWGGQMDFLDDSNSYLVDYELEPTTTRMNKAISEEFSNVFTSKMNWAEPNIDHLRQQMRRCYEDQMGVEIRGKRAREHVEKLTWDVSAHDIIYAIERIVQ